MRTAEFLLVYGVTTSALSGSICIRAGVRRRYAMPFLFIAMMCIGGLTSMELGTNVNFPTTLWLVTLSFPVSSAVAVIVVHAFDLTARRGSRLELDPHSSG